MADQYIRDYVLPIVEIEKQDSVMKIKKFCGTCFLVNGSQNAITCKHITENKNNLFVLSVQNGKWVPIKITKSIEHETEDVAVIEFENFKILPDDSFFELVNSQEYSSRQYAQWSYPEDVVYEIFDSESNSSVIRPDLVYLQGYIRRRLNNKGIMPNVHSLSLYELSELGIGGCSGSPIVKYPTSVGSNWEVIGIYCAFRTTEMYGSKVQLGYAVRMETVYNWISDNLLK